MNFKNCWGLPLLTVLLVLLPSCYEKKFREGKTFVGGKYVPAETLNQGHLTYVEYCISCHGEKGDGVGIASKGLLPPPRDFTKGLFKFGKVASGELPHDDDLKEIIKKGLKGTAMLPWDISEERADSVVQYIKTFAPQVWEVSDKTLAKKVELVSDPYSAHSTFAIEKGRDVYHVMANCQSCHRAYVTPTELNEMSMRVEGRPLGDWDESIYQLKLQESEYQVSIVPPDFTWHEIRSASTVPELAQRIAAGVGGTSMPMWKGVLTDEEIWAVSYYVQSLVYLKGTAKRGEVLNRISVKK